MMSMLARTFGNRMSLKLTDDDRRAVDLLLDAQSASQPDGNGANRHFLPSGTELTRRVHVVEQVLQTLRAWPVSDPSPDLKQRTLRRVEEMVAEQTIARQPAAQSFATAPRPA